MERTLYKSNKFPFRPVHGLSSGLVGAIALSVFLVACTSSEHPEHSVSYDVMPAKTSQRQAKLATAAPTASVANNRNVTAESADFSAQAFAGSQQMHPAEPLVPVAPTKNTEKYQQIDSNPVVLASREQTSTFSIDVDTGSYSNVRRLLESGQLPQWNAVRVEELINYFNYDYPLPQTPETPFSVTTEFAPSPWNKKRHLLHIGLQGYKPADEANSRPAANLVFLLDVSGSMQAANKLGLVKSSIKMLGKQLNSNDSVSIVVYAGATGVVLEPTAGDRYPEIAAALDSLSAGGSTNGEAGIKLAYQLATKAFNPEGINRVILATDGDFNVGVADIEALKNLVARERESGIALTTLGFGRGNYNDHLMENLADIGNGNYAYIDNIQEARKVLVEEMDATLLTIAKDVKIQVEFNPAVVSEYRLIGYVNRRLANEDFNNDKVDAGEIGAGHTVTALYEVALVGSGAESNTPLRYPTKTPTNSSTKSTKKSSPNAVAAVGGDEILELRLRYKPVLDAQAKLLPESLTRSSQLISKVLKLDEVNQDINSTSDAFRFSAAIAAFGQQLRQGKHTGNFSLDDTISLAESARGDDRLGYRAGFLQLARLAATMMGTTTGLNDNHGTERDSG